MSDVLAYRYRLLPSKAQHRALERILEDQRQLYNAALEERIACYRKTGHGRSYFDQCNALTECRRALPEMAATPLRIQRATLKRLNEAYVGFFRRLKTGERSGFPRFKGRGWFDTFAFSEWRGIAFDGRRLRFNGMPSGLRVHLHRPLLGTPLSCAFRRDAKGWSVCFQIRVAPLAKRVVAKAIGVDIGIKTLAALSDGVLIPNPRVARKAEREMRRHQRQLARCKRGSGRRGKVKTLVARLHAKIANTRATYLHQQSAMLVRNYDLIAVEALNVKGLARTHLARSVHDAGWGTLINLIRYKAERAGAHLIEVDPKRTSQECPNCGAIARKTLAERVHSCACGCVLDRDVAAAKVILGRAVAGPWFDNVAHT